MIVNAVRDAFSRVIEVGASAGYLIRDALFGAPPTTEVDSGYTPPFSGGQCDTGYRVETIATYPSGNTVYAYYGVGNFANRFTEQQQRSNGTVLPSPITTIEQFAQANGDGIRMNGIVVGFFGLENFTQRAISVEVSRLLPEGKSTDDCGDLPNPNPGPPIGDSGLANSLPPNIVGDGVAISEGLAPLPAAGALAAALAALRSALELAALAEALADALQALKDLLKNKDDKDDKKNVKVIQLDLGLIQKDGFLRLYPSGDSQKYQALYLDLQVRDIPRSFGRFFGRNSPNYYRFTELGYIAWVSPTFGVISVDSIQFSRVSIGCPDGAIGFFYHLGLNGIIKANATAFYEEEQGDESE